MNLSLNPNFRHPEPMGDTAPNLYPGEVPVSYQPTPGAARPSSEQLQRFVASRPGRTATRQMLAATDRLIQFLHQNDQRGHARQTAQLNDFKASLAQVPNERFHDHIDLMWGTGKRDLDCFVSEIGTSPVSVLFRVELIRKLCPGLTVCVSGVSSNIHAVAQDLYLGGRGIRGVAKRFWSDLLKEKLAGYCRQVHGSAVNYRGNEVHYVNAYRNHVAADYGITAETDPFIPGHLIDNAAVLNRGRDALSRTMTAEALLGAISEHCFTAVRTSYAAFIDAQPPAAPGGPQCLTLDAPLNEAQAHALRQHFIAQLQGVLQLEYGGLDIAVLINEHHGGATLEAPYTVIKEPTLIIRALADKLESAGVLGRLPIETVIGQDGDSFVVKTLARMMVFAESTTGGVTNVMPIVGGAVPSASIEAMLAARVRGDRPVTLFREVSAEQVYTCITAGCDSERWIQRFQDRNFAALLDNVPNARAHSFRRLIQESPALSTATLDAAHDEMLERGFGDLAMQLINNGAAPRRFANLNHWFTAQRCRLFNDASLPNALKAGDAETVRALAQCVNAPDSGLSAAQCFELLSSQVYGAPGIWHAMSNGHAEAITAFGSLVNACQLDPEQKLELLIGKTRNFNSSAIDAAMSRGHSRAVTAFCQIISASPLASEQKLALYFGKDESGSPAVRHAIFYNHSKTVAAFYRAVNASPLTAEYQMLLLAAHDQYGTALRHAMLGGHFECARAIRQAIKKSALTSEQKKDLFEIGAAAQVGLTVLGGAYRLWDGVADFKFNREMKRALRSNPD